MSYTESRRCLLFACRALKRGHYRRAAGRYAQVVTGLQPQTVTTRLLAPEDVPLVRHYAAACRGWATALAGLAHPDDAETVLLAALGKLRRFISNLGVPAGSRALLLAEYKRCFYTLAEVYTTHERPERLAAYVRQHGAELETWRRDLNLLAAAHHLN